MTEERLFPDFEGAWICEKHKIERGSERYGSNCYRCLEANCQQLQAENEQMKERYKEYERLWEIASQDKCNGDCDLNPPHNSCSECIATRAINECGEIIDIAISEIDQALKGAKDEPG